MAMLANGPAWTKTGWYSTVQQRVGWMVLRIQAAIAPATSRSSAVMGFPRLS
jgi:hypothetical protein